MFCPRCGRPVSEGANFCGGCGLPRREIERYARQQRQEMQTPAVAPRPEIPDIDLDELTGTINRLQGDLDGSAPVTDYNIFPRADTTAEDLISTIEQRQAEAEDDYTRQMPDITRWAKPVQEQAPERPEPEEAIPRFVPEAEDTAPAPAPQREIRANTGVYYDDNGMAKSESGNLFNGGFASGPAAGASFGRANVAQSESYDEVRRQYASTQSSYSYNAPQHPLYNDTRNVPPTYRQAQRPQRPQVPRRPKYSTYQNEETERPLTTVDFIWMMIIAGIPLVGILYMIYLGFFQSESVNKRSWARAMLIVSIFGVAVGIVFMIGLISSLI